MSYKNVPYCLKTDEEREKNLEKNLDFIHRTHMEASEIFYAYREGKLPHTRELCVRAMDNYRLPQYYREVYQGLVKTIDETLAKEAVAETAETSKARATIVRDQAITTEELARTMLRALAISEEEGADKDESKVRNLEDIADKAKALGGASDEAEKTTLFKQLVQLANDGEEGSEDGKDNMKARGASIRRRSSH